MEAREDGGGACGSSAQQQDDQGASLLQRRRALGLGLAIGDSLGATSEFQIPREVTKNCVERYPGWPAKLVGGGKAHWRLGAPTDDTEMAMGILRAVHNAEGKWDAQGCARQWRAWMSTMPKDIGHTTRMALNAVGEAVEQPYHGGLVVWRRNTGNAANGSLMRNGVVPALFYQEDQEIEALDVTVLHSIITHYGPLPVLTCALHTLLIRDALLNPSSATRPPTMEDIKQLVQVRWKRWKESTTNEPAKEWLRNIGKKELELQEQKLLSELKGFESFDPFRYDYRGCSGYCVLGLKIALWALYWSFREDHPPLAEWLPEWPFEKHGFETLMWVVLIGADADTNGAIAGPLLAAYHPDIPSTLQKGLLVKPLLEQYIQ